MKKPILLSFLFGIMFILVTGFNLKNAIIPKDQILSGGPPKDGIPAILHPQFKPAAQTRFMKSDDAVIAVRTQGVTKAYPVKILIWHEVVNDRLQAAPIVVTF